MNKNKGDVGVLGVIQIVFIILKLCDLIAWSWFWVLIPLWISLILIVIILIIYHIKL